MKASITLAVVLALLAGVPAVAQQEVRQITFGAKQDVDPMVSPNGDHLAFSSNRTGNYDVFMLTFGRTGEVQVTQSPKDDRYPHWTPDNRRIVFDSARTGNGDLYVVDMDGRSGYRQLTDREDMEEYPSYSRGSALLFARAPRKALQLRPKLDVVFAESDGNANNARALAEGDEPRFSPDGSRIVFVSRRTKNNDIWVMKADGSMQTQLTTDEKDDDNPCFSPDGRNIVFASKRTGNYDIWVMNSDGSNQRQLTSSVEDEMQPCWSMGGYIYYVRQISPTRSNIFRIKAPN